MAYYKTTEPVVIAAVKKWIQQRMDYRKAVSEIIKNIGAGPRYYTIGVEQRVVGFEFPNGVPKIGYKKGKWGGYFPRKDNKEARALLSGLPTTGDIDGLNAAINFTPGLIQPGMRFVFSPALFFNEKENSLYYHIDHGLEYTAPDFAIELKESEYYAMKKEISNK